MATGALAQELLAACQAGALRAGWSLSRALGVSVKLTVHCAGHFSARRWGQRDGQAQALVVLMPVEQRAALLAFHTAVPGFPAWLSRPDGLQRGRLAAMAQELGTALLPRRFSARDCAAGAVRQLGAAIQRGGTRVETLCVEMSLAQPNGRSCEAWLIWPLDAPAAVFDLEPAMPFETDERCVTAREAGELRQVKLSVRVVLAQRREALSQIAKLSPGDILRFDKSHRAPLQLQVGGQCVAAGQCVEIGRRLGLVITSS